MGKRERDDNHETENKPVQLHHSYYYYFICLHVFQAMNYLMKIQSYSSLKPQLITSTLCIDNLNEIHIADLPIIPLSINNCNTLIPYFENSNNLIDEKRPIEQKKNNNTIPDICVAEMAIIQFLRWMSMEQFWGKSGSCKRNEFRDEDNRCKQRQF